MTCPSLERARQHPTERGRLAATAERARLAFTVAALREPVALGAKTSVICSAATMGQREAMSVPSVVAPVTTVFELGF